MSKFTVYNIKGCDKTGDFDVFRRFSDFDILRDVMVGRWPGCFIPPIPAKKAIGNKDENVVEDRRRFL